MKKIVFLSFLMLGLGLQAQTPSEVEVKASVSEDIVADGQRTIKKQEYREDGTLDSYVIARTNLVKGTYLEYHKNGKLKTFRIVN